MTVQCTDDSAERLHETCLGIIQGKEIEAVKLAVVCVEAGIQLTHELMAPC